MSFSLLGAMARRRAMPLMTRCTQKRTMSLGHAPPPPEWTGLDKMVRSYLPHDYQISAAVLGGYATLIILWQLSSAFSTKKPAAKVEAPAKVEASTVSSGDIPDLDSPDFEKFLERVLGNDDQLKALLEKA